MVTVILFMAGILIVLVLIMVAFWLAKKELENVYNHREDESYTVNYEYKEKEKE